MLSNMRLSLALVATIAVADATRTTLNDYVVLKTAINNPPACGVSYANVDVNRITALSGISGNYDTNCGACIEVCGSAGCGHLLVVDSCVGPDHLDISTTAGPAIVGSDTGVHEATYTFVDSSNCAGIWDGNGIDAVPNPPPNWEILRNGGGGTPAPAPVQQDQTTPQPPVSQPHDQYESPPFVEQPQPSAVEQPVPLPVNTAPPAPPLPAPTAAAPVEEAPVEEAPVEEAPVEEAPVEEAPVEEVPVEEAPVEEASAPPSAVPGDFYEEDVHSSTCTTITTVPVQSYGTPLAPSAASTAPVSSASDAISSAAPSPSSLLTIITGTPTATVSLVLPTAVTPTPSAPTPPAFTGAASQGALPVMAGSVFGVALAFFL